MTPIIERVVPIPDMSCCYNVWSALRKQRRVEERRKRPANDARVRGEDPIARLAGGRSSILDSPHGSPNGFVASSTQVRRTTNPAPLVH